MLQEATGHRCQGVVKDTLVRLTFEFCIHGDQ